MRNRLTIAMTIAVLASFATILVMNMTALMGILPARYISPNDVKGMAVSHREKFYTLNFAQQNALVNIFNRAIPIVKSDFEKRKVAPPNGDAVKKIVIYRFDAPDIEITPIGYTAQSKTALTNSDKLQAKMVFSTPSWNSNSPLEEASADEMYTILQTTYDP